MKVLTIKGMKMRVLLVVLHTLCKNTCTKSLNAHWRGNHTHTSPWFVSSKSHWKGACFTHKQQVAFLLSAESAVQTVDKDCGHRDQGSGITNHLANHSLHSSLTFPNRCIPARWLHLLRWISSTLHLYRLGPHKILGRNLYHTVGVSTGTQYNTKYS